jgi:DNA-binding NarL/FixJ family response regulator
MTKPTRVILADDHATVRAGVRTILNHADDIEVVGEASNGVEAIQLVHQLEPDVLLLDMEMPLLNGIEVARQLNAENSPVRILALSAFDDRNYIQGVMENGAAGYLTKEEVPEFIVKAVRSVARGEKGWFSRRVARQMASWSDENA